MTAYCASKHAVVGMSKVAAHDYGMANIRTNAICPSFTNTPLLSGMETMMGSREALEEFTGKASAMGRMATPEEIANTILWACSDQASYVNGQAIAINGGGIG